MSAEEFWNELGCPQPPGEIWQRPFDYDPEHLHNLSQFALRRGNYRWGEFWEVQSPAPADFIDYALDLQYEEIQTDLLVFALRRCPWI